MGIIKEPKDIDFIIKSEPWTDKELEDFRKLMKEQKAKKCTKKISCYNQADEKALCLIRLRRTAMRADGAKAPRNETL